MSKRIAIVYGTTEGHTRKICEHLANELRRRDDQVEIFEGSQLPEGFELADFDGIIVGGSLHEGKHQRYIRQFADEHAAELTAMPSAFFSVSLSAAGDDDTEARRYMQAFLNDAGWSPAQKDIFAGALKYTQYNWLKRFVMKKISASSGGDVDTSQDFEYTDWDEVTRFADEFHDLLAG